MENKMDIDALDLREVIQTFKEEYPTFSTEGLNGMQMRGILKGDIILVKISGTRKYEMWKKEDILSGKLDRRNAKIKRANQIARMKKKEQEEQFYRWIRETLGPEFEAIFRGI